METVKMMFLVPMTITVVWYVTPCLSEISLPPVSAGSGPEDEGEMFLRNIGLPPN
jgi:hypothetical protein